MNNRLMNGQKDAPVEESGYDGTAKRMSKVSFGADTIPAEAITKSEPQLDPEKLLSAFGKYGRYQVCTVRCHLSSLTCVKLFQDRLK